MPRQLPNNWNDYIRGSRAAAAARPDRADPGSYFPWPDTEWEVPEFRPLPPLDVPPAMTTIFEMVKRGIREQSGPDVARADGDAICPKCERPYRDHPMDYITTSVIDGKPFLYIACDGTRIKT